MIFNVYHVSPHRQVGFTICWMLMFFVAGMIETIFLSAYKSACFLLAIYFLKPQRNVQIALAFSIYSSNGRNVRRNKRKLDFHTPNVARVASER